MGYSHYWHRVEALDVAEFRAFGVDVARLVEHARASDLPIVGAGGRPEPQIDDERIAFNAAGEAGSDDLTIERVVTPRPGMQLANGLWFECSQPCSARRMTAGASAS